MGLRGWEFLRVPYAGGNHVIRSGVTPIGRRRAGVQVSVCWGGGGCGGAERGMSPERAWEFPRVA